MKIDQKLKLIADYFNTNRQRGHTSSALNGVNNTKHAKLLVGSVRETRQHANAIALTNASMRGRTNPIVLDNALVHSLCLEALAEIKRITDLTNAS